MSTYPIRLSPLSFFVPSYPRSLSIAGLNTDGTLCSLDTSMGDGVTLADTSPTFFSTSQDESTSGAGAGVAQDITDAREISSALPPSNATAASTTVTLPTTTTATTSTSPIATTATITTPIAFPPVSDPPTMPWWNYPGGGLYP